MKITLLFMLMSSLMLAIRLTAGQKPVAATQPQ